MLVSRLGEAAHCLTHVQHVRLRFASAFGADEQAVFGANRTMVVCAQLKPFTPRIFAALVVFNPADVTQAQLAVGLVAFELGLYLGFGVIQDEVVASACG